MCGSEPTKERYEAREMMFGSRAAFIYRQCRECGSLWLEDVPTDMSPYYGADYYAFSEPTLYRWIRQARMAYWIAHLLVMRTPPRLPAWWPDGAGRTSKVLDVGCGQGNLLLHLKALGFRDLTGIDPYIAAAVSFPGGPVISKMRLADVQASYDVVIMNHSFEHMSHPGAALAHVRRILSREGSALIRCPVSQSFTWRTYSTDWVQLDAPRHLFIPSVAGMRLLAKASGLNVVSEHYDSTAFQFWGSEQYRKGIPLNDPRSYSRHAGESIFTRTDIGRFSRLADELNQRGDGDQATFRLTASLDEPIRC